MKTQQIIFLALLLLMISGCAMEKSTFYTTKLAPISDSKRTLSDEGIVFLKLNEHDLKTFNANPEPILRSILEKEGRKIRKITMKWPNAVSAGYTAKKSSTYICRRWHVQIPEDERSEWVWICDPVDEVMPFIRP